MTRLLRTNDGGTLKSQEIGDEEFPYLCENGVIKPEFQGISVVNFDNLTISQRNVLFAMGGDRANSQVGYTMLNVLFLREHNRVARRARATPTRAGTTSGCSRPRATS